MIITCAECATQFQLDEARVPESGIRVRCSLCKHAFFVAHPDALDDAAGDPATRVVRDVLDAEPVGAPEATHDLEHLDALPDVRGGGGERDEESWEFGDGGPPPDASGPEPRDHFDESFEAARDAVDDLLGSPWQAPEPPAASFPVEEEKGAASDAWEPPAGIDGPAPSDEPLLPLQSEDPWAVAAWSERAASGPRPEVVAPPSPDSLDFDLADPSDAARLASDGLPDLDDRPAGLGDGPADLDAGPAELDAGPADLDELDVGDEGAAFDDDALGDALESFETAAEAVDSDPFEEGLASPDRADDHATPEAWGLEAPCDRGGVEADAMRAPGELEATQSAAPAIGFGMPLELEPRSGRLLAWLARAGNALGWGAVAILAAAALWGSVAPRSAPARASGWQALAGFEATDVEGRWVENTTLGPLYVVSGELHNPGSETKAPGAKLVVRLLDAQGQPIDAATASVGPPLGVLLLREGRPEDLREHGEAGALELARTAVAPGARIAFEAAVLDLPDDARRFDLATATR